MSWQTLRPQLKTLLSTISGVQEMASSPKITFEAYPSGHIVPSSNENDYETTTENSRTYAFTARFFYSTKEIGVETAMSRLEQIIDAAIDLIDQEDQKGSDERTVGINLPARYMFINIWAVPTAWGEVPDQQLLMGELSVRIRVSVDVN